MWGNRGRYSRSTEFADLIKILNNKGWLLICRAEFIFFLWGKKGGDLSNFKCLMFYQLQLLSEVDESVVCVLKQTLLCAFCIAEPPYRLLLLESQLNIFMKLLSRSHFLWCTERHGYYIWGVLVIYCDYLLLWFSFWSLRSA